MTMRYIRHAVPGDLHRIKILGKVLEQSSEAQTPPHLRKLYFSGSLPDAYWLDYIHGRTGFLLVSENEADEVVGMAAVQTHGSVAHLNQLVVLSACRNQGYGQALAEEAMAEARRLGKTTFTLNVLEANDHARRLYERLGFTPYRTFYTQTLTETEK